MKEQKVSVSELMPLIREGLSMGKTVCFAPRGMSMLPMLRQGRDTVTLTAVTGKLKKYDLPLYVRDDGAYVLHRIVAVGENYSCIGDNQYLVEKGVRQDQLIGVVCGFNRGKKYISVESPAYRIYCRLWWWLLPVRKICFKIWRRLKKR